MRNVIVALSRLRDYLNFFFPPTRSPIIITDRGIIFYYSPFSRRPPPHSPFLLNLFLTDFLIFAKPSLPDGVNWLFLPSNQILFFNLNRILFTREANFAEKQWSFINFQPNFPFNASNKGIRNINHKYHKL